MKLIMQFSSVSVMIDQSLHPQTRTKQEIFSISLLYGENREPFNWEQMHDNLTPFTIIITDQGLNLAHYDFSEYLVQTQMTLHLGGSMNLVWPNDSYLLAKLAQ